MTAPTRLLGATDPYAYGYTSQLYDALETVPDLQPGYLATQTYAQMRRDSRLAAILAGYTLQIRRASWQIEPGSCRPEVVQLVADDMGLPVKGEDQPGAARTRGVSWNEHLRSALLCLTYGHMCFEALAEMVDGKARLVALSERMPHTLTSIHADPKTGALLGVTQDQPRRNDLPQIRADRLAFYTHDRETSWFGTSLLRASYAPWYLKRELMRVHATSARRFGMGVPTVEWAAGTNPTPAQVAEAQQLASAARVGEQAGASLPPGASLVLRGLSGGTVDVLGYIKFLNAEMAGAALMPHMDLGHTESGSRATATAFLDSWILALGSIAEEIADVATRQIAARVVAWNWGDQEQVPRVVVAGVGTQREVTAESLNALLQSGALSADPGLEAWVRREYRLPEREEPEGRTAPSGRIFEHDVTSGVIIRNERRAQIGLPPVEGGDTLADPGGQKPAADRTPVPPQTEKVAAKRRKQADGQLSLPIAAAAGDDEAGQVQVQFEAALAALLAQWPVLAAPLVDDLAGQVEEAIAAGDMAALGGLAASAATVDGVAATVGAAMIGLASSAASQVAASAQAQGVDVPPVAPDEGRLAELAAVTVALIASAYAGAAARRALLAPAGSVGNLVRAALEDMSTAQRGTVADQLSAALSVAQGDGRLAVLASAPAVAYVGVEDAEPAANRCGPCREAAGRRYDTLTDALRDRPNGMHLAACEGGARCRGYLRPVWV